MIFKCLKLDQEARTPSKAHPLDSGFDLYTIEGVSLRPGQTAIVRTGIAIELPYGFEAQIRPRSGISAKSGLVVMLGTIDNQYRGELGIIVKNVGFDLEVIPKGMKLAQLVIMQLPIFDMELVDELTPARSRNSSGFGSSGNGV
jgi:dUTP pyrophosphatase